jgi:hypothetical protein
MDPVMSVILKAGALSLRELFARLGTEPTVRRLAHLRKNGDVRFEVDPTLHLNAAGELSIEADQTEDEIAARLLSINDRNLASHVEVLPTAKAWRSPFAAA